MQNSIAKWVWITGIVLSNLFTLQAQAESASEAQLKTIYLYNFSRYVQWPESKRTQTNFLFCTYPDNRFGDILYQLEQRKIQDKVIQIKELSSVEDIKLCHAVFIDTVPDTDLAEVVSLAKKHHVLTISDKNQFADKGGMIQMFLENNKIRFNINFISSKEASLQINSKLIQLASKVIKEAS